MSKNKRKQNKAGQQEQKKIKVLAWCDSPAVSTGFAQVTKNVLGYLARTGKYEIDVIGINDTGSYKDPARFPFKIWPAKSAIESTMGDFHGRPRLVAAVLGKEPEIKLPWDIVFTLNDPFILEEPLMAFDKGTMEILKVAQIQYKKAVEQGKIPPEYLYKIISYWPVDSAVKENWVDVIAMPDKPVAYTEYGKREILKANKHKKEPIPNLEEDLGIINHGVKLETFKVVPGDDVQKFKDTYFEGKVKKETFLITVIARNQMRKDLPRTLQVFSEFLKRRPQSFLYLHCKETDAWGSLKEYARNWPNLEYGENWGCPSNFNVNQGIPIEAVNLVYNASDCILSTTQGEGWGFYNSEGFATKTLVVGPNNTTTPELFGYDYKEDVSDIEAIYPKLRGIPYKCGSTSSEWAVYGVQDLERIRPLANVDDAVKKLIWAYDNPDKVKEIVERAYNWIQNYSWDIICQKWDTLFQEAYKELTDERTEAVRKSKEPRPADDTAGKTEKSSLKQ